MRRDFEGIDLDRAVAPDETTILNFSLLLEADDLCDKFLDTVNPYLDCKGVRISTGTIVDATIIPAPSSTKNENKERDPEMRQIKKVLPVELKIIWPVLLSSTEF